MDKRICDRTALGPGMETRDPMGSGEILEGFV